MKKINKGKIAKFTVWFIVLALSVVGGFVAMYYGMEVIYRILSKVIVMALLFAAMMVFLETYLAKHPNPLQHEIDKQKAQQELKEEMDKRFK